MNARHFFLSCALCAYSAAAFAQWQWVDESGRNVFSDRPPPSHIPAAKILKRPHGSMPVPPSPPPVSAPAAATAAAPADGEAAAGDAADQADKKAPVALTPAEKSAKAAEESKRLAEEAARKKQEAQQAKVRKENCERARVASNTLQPGMRVATINDKGERGFMSDAQRQGELTKAQQVIKNNC